MKQFPEYFTKLIKQIYTQSEYDTISKWFNTLKRKTCFRVNPLQASEKSVLRELKAHDIRFEANSPLLYSYSLLELDDEKKLWDLDLIKNGAIYLQSLSSQIVGHIVDIQQAQKILDLSAAPWWKTSHLASLRDNTWEIVALDNNAIRMDKLKFTLKRQGVKNTQTFKIDARNYSEIHIWQLFDCIVFDAPCSAEWRINLSKEKTYSFLSETNNKRHYKLQKQILSSNLQLLKQGWELIYSTCTLSPIENEAIVHFLLCNYPELKIIEIDPAVFWKLDIKDGITHFWDHAFKKEVSLSKRILPSEKSEWFFIAKFKKL